MSLEGNAEASAVLRGKIRNLTVPLIDKTLTKEEQAAEAKATGDAIDALRKETNTAISGVRSSASAAQSTANNALTVGNEAKTAAANAQSTADTNAKNIAAKPSRNLLYNWHFPRLINQLGSVSGNISQSSEYLIDRWMSFQTVVSNMKYYFDATRGLGIEVLSAQAGIGQRLEFPLESGLTYTLSALIDGEMYSAQFIGGVDSVKNCADTIALSSVTNYGGYNTVRVIFSDSGVTHWIKAAKLELGSQQTLAHQDGNGNWVLNEIPDYGEQLRRCQLFYRPNLDVTCVGRSSGDGTTATFVVPVSLRGTPTPSNVSVLVFAQEEYMSASEYVAAWNPDFVVFSATLPESVGAFKPLTVSFTGTLNAEL